MKKINFYALFFALLPFFVKAMDNLSSQGAAAFSVSQEIYTESMKSNELKIKLIEIEIDTLQAAVKRFISDWNEFSHWCAAHRSIPEATAKKEFNEKLASDRKKIARLKTEKDALESHNDRLSVALMTIKFKIE